jgi:hypothetical protein
MRYTAFLRPNKAVALITGRAMIIRWQGGSDMKRFVALLLALLMLLCACAQTPAETTLSTTEATTPTTVPSEPIEPMGPDFGLYQPDSVIEEQTGGAVKYFPLAGADYYAVEPMGDGLLLFSGEETTTLTLLREGMDPVEIKMECFIYPDDCTLRICEDGLHYYDNLTFEIVSLNSGLQETKRTPMPEDFKESPALSGDGKLVYYYSDTALRCFDVNTGISRLLRESTFEIQQIWGMHFDDTVIECFILDGKINQCHYVSAQTGELLTTCETFPDLVTNNDLYFTDFFDGTVIHHLLGTRGEKPQCLDISTDYISVKALHGIGACIACATDATGTTLDLYDLDKGTLSAQIQLNDVLQWYLTEDEMSGLIWLLGGDQSGSSQALYCWDPMRSPTDDETSYLTPFYTAQEPDVEGLKKIAEQAKTLSQQYGVRIRVWEDALKTMPMDYTFEPEYRVPAYKQYLPALEKTLSSFPDGVLKKLGKASQNGVLTISLVQRICGDNAIGSLTIADGVHYWDNGSGYIAVIVSDVEVDQNLYHEIFHAIDSYVMAECVAYDNWPDLNPADFFYDYDYITNQFREDYQYLEDENRAFIDMYSMSYPKEDRARIFEYAMMEGNEKFFQSEIMQTKLKTLCSGIRKAFGLKNYTEPLLWEQYLK